jgi:hypothetical protein
MNLSLNNYALKVELNFFESILAMRSDFEIPLSQIESVTDDLPKPALLHGIFKRGTYVPGLIRLGNFYPGGYSKIWSFRKSAWYYTKIGQHYYLNIKLNASGHFNRVVIGMKNKDKLQEWLTQIREAILK